VRFFIGRSVETMTHRAEPRATCNHPYGLFERIVPTLSVFPTDFVSTPDHTIGADAHGGTGAHAGSDPVESQSGARDADPVRVVESSLDWHAMAFEALNALGSGLALLDSRGHVLFANDACARMLERCALIKPSIALPIALANPTSNGDLRRAILGAAGGSSAGFCVRDYEGHVILSAVVLPLPLAPPWDRPWRAPAILLATNELVRSRAIPDHWLSQMFGLTRAEASVANWLVSGRTVDAYAEQRGVSLETARSQLKAVLSKTGMSRQAQLVAALARLPVERER
jgi:DNA-binding CsgD family transcriptional regulator